MRELAIKTAFVTFVAAVVLFVGLLGVELVGVAIAALLAS